MRGSVFKLSGGLLGFILLLPVFVGAQEQNRTEISVTPAVIEVATQPGITRSSKLSIRNGGESSIPISFELQSLVSNDELVSNNSKLSDATKWIEIENNTLLFAPKETKTVPIKIDVPKNASPGGHYAQLAVRALSLEVTQGSSSITVPEITINILINVAGDINESYEFVSYDNFPLFVGYNEVQTLDFSVENTGNTHGLITPNLVIEKDGSEISRKQLTPKVILPGAIKKYTEEWTSPDDYGLYSASIEFVGGSEGEMVYSNSEKVFVSHSPVLIIILGFATILSVHTLRYRKNITKAYEAFRYGSGAK